MGSASVRARSTDGPNWLPEVRAAIEDAARTRDEPVTADGDGELPELIERARFAALAAEARDHDAAEFTWPDTTGLTPEQAILADCEALVDAGQAEWIEPE